MCTISILLCVLSGEATTERLIVSFWHSSGCVLLNSDPLGVCSIVSALLDQFRAFPLGLIEMILLFLSLSLSLSHTHTHTHIHMELLYNRY